MMYLALFNLIAGVLLSINGYRTLHNPLPQYEARYSTGSHRRIAVLVLGLGILLLWLGVGLGVKASFDEWLNPPACGT
jgi:putative Mn2+ efflux pump MntP